MPDNRSPLVVAEDKLILAAERLARVQAKLLKQLSSGWISHELQTSIRELREISDKLEILDREYRPE